MKKLIMLVLALLVGISAATAAPGTEINVKAELTQLTSNGVSIEDAVKQLVTAHPNMAASITSVAIHMAPHHAVTIATAAVDAAPDQAHTIQQAATEAAPKQSSKIVAALANPVSTLAPTAAGGNNTPAPVRLASGVGPGAIFGSGGAGGGSGGGGTTVSP